MRRKQKNRHHLNAIEYIGPRPKKPARKPWGGGWLMVLLVVVCVGYLSRPFIGKILAQSQPITELKVEKAVAWLNAGDGFGHQLAAVALERTHQEVTYDPAYYKISYPGGDVPQSKGANTDVIIRSYRALGIDLQQLVHEDMKALFHLYPQIWNASEADPNIDHRRVPNLQRFFSRFGTEIEVNEEGVKIQDFNWGDIVVWRLPDGATHLGIVVPGPGKRREEMWIVHNKSEGPKWEDVLLEYQVIGHYRYDGIDIAPHSF
jgi:uncharacterized protein YijF (DUF1287 family)